MEKSEGVSSYYKGVNKIAKKNVGKILEQNWKLSCPDYLFVFRPPDAAQSFDMSSKLRFSQHSLCDYIMFDGNRNTLWTIELKSVAGTSISFEREKTDKGVIRYYQIESLKKTSAHKNVCSGLVIDFRGSDNTYFLPITQWDRLINSIEKKSFNEKDLLTYARPVFIKKRKLKVNYRYDVEKFLEETRFG